jgi:hypothetical protein
MKRYILYILLVTEKESKLLADSVVEIRNLDVICLHYVTAKQNVMSTVH